MMPTHCFGLVSLRRVKVPFSQSSEAVPWNSRVWPETSSEAGPSRPGVTSFPVHEPSMAVEFVFGGVELADAASQQLDWEVVEQPEANMSAMETGIKIILFI